MGILNSVDENLNQVDAWIVKQDFDTYKKLTDEKIMRLNIELNACLNTIKELDGFVKYLEYEIFELKKDIQH